MRFLIYRNDQNFYNFIKKNKINILKLSRSLKLYRDFKFLYIYFLISIFKINKSTFN
jgi:hypothetical protein